MEQTGFLRHVRACNNARLPGDRLAFLIGKDQVGWVSGATALALDGMPDVARSGTNVFLDRPEALQSVAERLAAEGVFRWRHEDFDVYGQHGGLALTRVDRGAIPIFGIQAVGVHLNGLVDLPGGLHLWIARRAADKLLDPGKLDHIVAGGVPAGLQPMETLIKEAAEEAAIPPNVLLDARKVCTLSYAMDRPEGLRRDRLYCYDLMLPADFIPTATDGEVASFELWPITRVMEAVRDTNDFKFNVNLVLIDLFIRLGLIAGAEAASLRSAL